MNRITLAGAALAVGLAAALSGCSEPAPVRLPEQGLVSKGREIVWTTDEAAMGVVRYGFRSGEYDRVAYPSAADREDKTFTTEHRVRLLSYRPDTPIYFQLMNTTPDFQTKVAPEDTVLSGDAAFDADPLVWTMIDVGWGDAHLVEMPTTGRRILVDAGERRDWENVRRYFEDEQLSSVDVAMATHIHADHIGGMIGNRGTEDDGVLGALDVGLFLDSANKSASRSAYGEALGLCRDRGIPVDTLYWGDTSDTREVLRWDPAVRVEVWNSGDGADHDFDPENQGKMLNNDSILLRISYGEFDFVMGGDAEFAAEQAVQSRADLEDADLESEVLKVHHHGRDDASSRSFLDRVDGRVGLIPTVRLELPYQGTTIRRLQERFMDVYASDLAVPLDIDITDDSGIHVRVTTDGRYYEVRAIPSRSFHSPTKPTPGEDLP